MKITIDHRAITENHCLKPRQNPLFPRADLARLKLGLTEDRVEFRVSRLLERGEFDDWDIQHEHGRPRWYQDIQHGRRKLKLDEALALANVLGLSIGQLVANWDENVPRVAPVSEEQVIRFRGVQPKRRAHNKFRVVRGGKG